MLTEKLKLLSEDQVNLILYCVNDGLSGKKRDYSYEDLKYIKSSRIFEKLNDFAPKIKPEYQKIMQDIVNLAINNEKEAEFQSKQD